MRFSSLLKLACALAMTAPSVLAADSEAWKTRSIYFVSIIPSFNSQCANNSILGRYRFSLIGLPEPTLPIPLRAETWEITAVVHGREWSRNWIISRTSDLIPSGLPPSLRVSISIFETILMKYKLAMLTTIVQTLPVVTTDTGQRISIPSTQTMDLQTTSSHSSQPPMQRACISWLML